MMNQDTIARLIALNIEMEGALRVLAARPCDEALEQARAALAGLNALMDGTGVCAATTDDAPAQAPADEAQAEEEPTEEAPAEVHADEITATVAVDEMPVRRETPDLRRAFTLNDKFLFRRELFGDSDAEFADTLDLLGAMGSLDEAREYLIQDLQWDEENPVVADFLAIVTNHFNQRGR